MRQRVLQIGDIFVYDLDCGSGFAGRFYVVTGMYNSEVANCMFVDNKARFKSIITAIKKRDTLMS